MTDGVEWTADDDKRYWADVRDQRTWWHELIDYEFERVHHGSGDALMDMCHLRERIERESIEGVAHGGMPEGMLYEDEYVEKYTEVCDVVERTYGGMPLEHCEDDAWKAGIVANNDPLFHTSTQARAAAMRIFELLGIMEDPRG